MGTSSSTIDVGKALRSLLSDAPFQEEHVSLLLSVPLSTTELDHAVPFTGLRCMRHYYTSNFAQLLHKLIEVIALLVQKSAAGHEVRDEVPKFHNALRLLRRLMPIAMEDGDTACEEVETKNRTSGETNATNDANGSNGESSEESEETDTADEYDKNSLSYSLPNLEQTSRTSFTKNFVQSFFVDGLACDESQRDRPLPPLAGQEERPLGLFLCRLLLDCCFLRGLALPEVGAVPGPSKNPNPISTKETVHPFIDEALLWYPGVGSSSSSTPARALGRSVSVTEHVTRYELLETVVTLLSYPMFLPPETRDRVFTEPMLNVEYAPQMPLLVASALNAVLSYQPFGSIPYISHWVGAEEKVVVASLRFLCAVLSAPGVHLEGRSEPAPATVTEATEELPLSDGNNPVLPKPRVVHSARKFIHDILPSEAHVILTRLQPMISLKLYSYRTVLPDSQRRLQVQNELMMLFWRLIELSPEFLTVFSRDKMALRYLLPMVDYALDAQRNLNAFSHLQLVLFLLLRLSEIRSFCIQCNAPFGERIPFQFDSDVVSYGDLLLIMLSTFLLMHREIIRPMHGSCSAIVSNLSYFLTNIGATASKKLTLVFASAATRCLGYAATRHSESAETRASVADSEIAVDQVVMINIVEAMASALQYHERGSMSLLTNLVTHRRLIADVEEAFPPPMGQGALSVDFVPPFLIGTLSAAVKVGNGLGTLVGVLPTPHPIIVKKMYITPVLELWAFSTMWSSLYTCSAPGTFGDYASIKLLRFS